MANVKSGTRFLYFDSTTGASVTRFLRILGIYWVSNEGVNLDIAADDDFLCKDIEAKVLLGKRAEAAGDGLEVTFGYPGLPCNGFQITAMDGGVCHVICTEEILA